MHDVWFQQDGATSHTSYATIDFSHQKLDDCLIIQEDNVSWLPKSCDMTELYYFLWDVVKEMYYADKTETIEIQNS